MATKPKPAKNPAKRPEKAKRGKSPHETPLTLADIRAGKARLAPDDLIALAERFGRLFSGSVKDKDVYSRLMFCAIAHALRWAKARGYSVPMKEVLGNAGA